MILAYAHIPGPFELLGRLLHGALASPGLRIAVVAIPTLALASLVMRLRSVRAQPGVRLQILPFRSEDPAVADVVGLYNGLHSAVRLDGLIRFVCGQSSVTLETSLIPVKGGQAQPRLSVVCARRDVDAVRSVIGARHPDARVEQIGARVAAPYVLRMRKRRSFLRPLQLPDGPAFDELRTERLISALQSVDRPVLVQYVITPASSLVEAWARWRLSQRDKRRPRTEVWPGDRPRQIQRSQMREREIELGLEAATRSLFCLEVRVVAEEKHVCRTVAADIQAPRGENYLSPGILGRPHRAGRLVRAAVANGWASLIPDLEHGLVTSSELACLWQLPGPVGGTARLARTQVPQLPPRPGVARPGRGPGLLTAPGGPVTIHPEMRRQNTAVVGTVDQGKSSYLAATIAEDLRRERCAVIVLDPKGDTCEAALSLVPEDRTVTYLDFARPTCGFNPLRIDAEPSAIADAVVSALKHIFDDGDIRASSDRYIRSAVTAVCIAEPEPSLWHAARLLVPSQRSYREKVTAQLRQRPEYREIGMFFADELESQLRDARSMTVAKLEAPVNKLQRFINPPSTKRVLLNETLSVDFDRIIREQEVLIVRGGLGTIGAGNSSALMQLLVGMLDAALARQQDRVPEEERIAVALKIDEAPQVINPGFADTMALKRSAGLETVACWQADSQWTDRDVRAQLDALFAHRVLFASASVDDARSSANLLMGQYSDSIAPRTAGRRSAHVSPDVRTHLPRHTALVSFTSPAGRLAPFIANTIPMRVNKERIRHHQEAQARRGGRELATEELQARSLLVDEATSELPLPATAHAGTSPPPPSASDQPSEQLTLGLEGTEPGRQLDRAAAAAPLVAPLGDLSGGPPPETYTELVALEDCPTIRHPRVEEPGRQYAPIHFELQVLSLLAELRVMLLSQLCRHLFGGRERAAQRQMKKFVDAGWVSYFEFNKSGGGRGPRCYCITTRGLAVLRRFRGTPDLHVPEDRVTAPEYNDVAARLVRHDLRAGGWMLALASHLGPGVKSIRGPRSAVALPPRVTARGVKRFIGPADLHLENEWYAADFLATDPRGRVRRNVEMFEPLEPDGLMELRLKVGGTAPTLDLLIELDATDEPKKQIAKLERYDHFLTGWAMEKRRHQQQGQPPLVVFVCRDEPMARRFCRAADSVVTSYRAEWGAPPEAASRAGRERIFFVAESDAHVGQLGAYRLASGSGAGEAPDQVRFLSPGLLA